MLKYIYCFSKKEMNIYDARLSSFWTTFDRSGDELEMAPVVK